MSIFATIAVVCTMATCSDYAIDTAQTMSDAKVNTQTKDNEFLNIWGDEQDLNKWLDKYRIGETVFEIVSIDFETKEINEEMIP